MFLLFLCETVMFSLSIIGDLLVMILAISLTHIYLYKLCMVNILFLWNSGIVHSFL